MQRKLRPLLFLTLSSFAFSSYVSQKDEHYFNYFLHREAAQLFHTKQFSLTKAKAVYGYDTIDKVYLSFSCFRMLGVKEARRLLLETVTEILDAINNDPLLIEKRMLRGGHFCVKDLHIEITSENVFSQDCDNSTAMKHTCMKDAEITYTSYDSSRFYSYGVKEFHESYSEAMLLNEKDKGNTASAEIVASLKNRLASVRAAKEKLKKDLLRRQAPAQKFDLEYFSVLTTGKKRFEPEATVFQTMSAISPVEKPIEIKPKVIEIQEFVPNKLAEVLPEIAPTIELPVSAPVEAPAVEKIEAPVPEVEAPLEAVPVEATPVQQEPAQEEPVQEEPVQEAPAQEAPAQEAPVQQAPVEEIPVQEVPVEAVPVQEVPVQEIPAVEVPAPEVPVEEIQIQEVPEVAPIEAPIEAPVEESLPIEPVIVPEQAVQEQAVPVEEAPLEETLLPAEAVELEVNKEPELPLFVPPQEPLQESFEPSQPVEALPLQQQEESAPLQSKEVRKGFWKRLGSFWKSKPEQEPVKEVPQEVPAPQMAPVEVVPVEVEAPVELQQVEPTAPAKAVEKKGFFKRITSFFSSKSAEAPPQVTEPAAAPKEEKKSFFKRITSIFKRKPKAPAPAALEVQPEDQVQAEQDAEEPKYDEAPAIEMPVKAPAEAPLEAPVDTTPDEAEIEHQHMQQIEDKVEGLFPTRE